MLQRTCRLQALSHPGIVRIFEVDEERGDLLLITEWLSGVSLQQLIEQGGARLTLSSSQMIIQAVANALVYAHSKNVFHGDVRAGNVFITDAGEVRLRGFEISAQDVAANPKGDRLAFSWFAYELLSGLEGRRERTHRPPGVTREQWRAMRDTMTGRDKDQPGNVLDVFAGSDTAASRVFLLHENAQKSPGRLGSSAWMTLGFVAILAVVGYFIFTRPEPEYPQGAAISPAVSAPGPSSVTPTAAEETSPREIAPASVPPEPALPVPAPPVPAPPVPAPKYSRALIDLPSETKSVAGDQPVAKIWVRRRGGLRGEVTFLWWTESGSAKVDRDFRQISQRTAIINDGANGVELLVPLVEDPSRNQPRTFYVKIDGPGSNATLGDLTLMQVTIVP
jgi:eukaryotic-like serine/threonine-protein kinase